MKPFLGVLGGIIVVATIYSDTQSQVVFAQRYVNPPALLLGGLLALVLLRRPRKPGDRFFFGAFAGLVVANIVLLAVTGFSANAITYAIGRGLADCILIGGGLALIANAAYPSRTM